MFYALSLKSRLFIGTSHHLTFSRINILDVVRLGLWYEQQITQYILLVLRKLHR